MSRALVVLGPLTSPFGGPALPDLCRPEREPCEVRLPRRLGAARTISRRKPHVGIDLELEAPEERRARGRGHLGGVVPRLLRVRPDPSA